MMNRRGSGILLHISSLPSRFGIGDLGPSAYEFADFLADAKQSYWQILPLNPTTQEYDNSPYHSISAFGCNTNLISPEIMVKDGFLEKSDLVPVPDFPEGRVDFDMAIRYKQAIYQAAFEQFSREGSGRSDYGLFCKKNFWWLEDFALFCSLKDHFHDAVWSDWPDELKVRQPSALESKRQILRRSIDREKFLQYVFALQWQSLRDYCNARGIRIIGDLPIYVDYDSADVWTNPTLFRLDNNLRPTAIAGVPPDYFSSTGQLWRNPLYQWEEHAGTGYAWWARRIERNLSLFDYVRIDHFRGLVAYWEVPADAENAIYGRWTPAPAEELLTTLSRRFSCLPVIAEDLGIITADVQEIIRKFNLPGMKVLIFAFTGELSGSPHIPHNLSENCILYTGTHDNTTIRGWFEKDATESDKKRLSQYLGREVTAEELPAVLIRLAMMSVASTVIVPAQDILGLGAESRMNRPGTTEGNWRWKLKKNQITPKVAEMLGQMTEIYGRA